MADGDTYRDEYLFESSITHTPHGWWHFEAIENGEIIFDYNGTFDECLDWLDRIGPQPKGST